MNSVKMKRQIVLLVAVLFATTAAEAVKMTPGEFRERISQPGIKEKILSQLNEAPRVTAEDWERASLIDADPPMVNVPSLGAGIQLKGKTMMSFEGRNISCFQGIKYADAATFKHSTLVSKYWNDGETVVEANHLGDKCVQRSYVGNFSSGSDDCLFLNVYIPEEPETTGPLPVMVFIHGGSFTSGDASLYLPTRLLDEDVILVVIQYRLGALGWLSLQDDKIPGNAGLSDQINSLKWVRAHIEDFGGDPEMVTIFGQSAGAASVSMLQTVAPPGLFSGVIAESGSALEYWAIDINPLQSAQILAEICDCVDSQTIDGIYTCLTTEKSTTDISDCTHTMVSDRRKAGYMGFEGTAPVVQADTIHSEYRLITKMPEEYIKSGEANDVPVMMGANRDEGSFVFGVMYMAYLVPLGLVDDLDYLENDAITDLLGSFGVEDQTKTLSRLLQDEYLPGVEVTSFESVTPGMIDLTGVLFIKAGTYQTALYHSQETYNSSTFFYSFDFESENSLFQWLFAYEEDLPFSGGVTHADELMYLFSLPSSLTDDQIVTKNRLVKMWTNFAKYRHPTPASDADALINLGIPTWQELDSTDMNYLLIQQDVTTEHDYTLRWHIQMDLSQGNVTGETTETPVTPVTEDPADIDKLEQERQAFLITMIIFIVAFVVSSGAAVYFYFKAR